MQVLLTVLGSLQRLSRTQPFFSVGISLFKASLILMPLTKTKIELIAGVDAKDSTSMTTPVPRYLDSIKDDLKGLTVGIPKVSVSHHSILTPKMTPIFSRNIWLLSWTAR